MKSAIIGNDKIIIGWLFILGLACSLLALFTHVSHTHDYFYIPNVVYFLDHPTQPMDFQIHWWVNSSNSPIVSYSQGTAMPYDYFRGIIAHYTRLDYITVYYLSDTAVAFLIPVAHFLLRNVFRSTVAERVRMILEENGFVNKNNVGEYIIVWK